MPWQCRLMDKDPATAGQPRRIGDMWYATGMVDDPRWADYYRQHQLSAEYRRDWDGKRAPLVVVLPNGECFCVDDRYSDPSGTRNGAGWTVTGEAPAITVSPSINCIGRYHGWLQNGQLSEDVEGRTFPR